MVPTGRPPIRGNQGPPFKVQNQGHGLLLAGAAGLFPRRCPGPQRHRFNLRMKSNSGSRNENRAVHFCPRPEASKKKKKSVIPEQIPFLPGLSAPSDSLPTITMPPLSQCPTSLHIKKKKKKKWRVPSSLAFPNRAWKLEEIQIKLIAH